MLITDRNYAPKQVGRPPTRVIVILDRNSVMTQTADGLGRDLLFTYSRAIKLSPAQKEGKQTETP